MNLKHSRIAQQVGIFAERYMARAGLLQQAMFEQMRLRELWRTDGMNAYAVPNIPVGAVAYASLGTSAVHVAGSLYVTEIYVPRSMMVTGIAVLNGATAGTDNLIAALYDGAGRWLANSTLAGTLASGANAFQVHALTTPFQMQNDGKYHVVVQANGTTTTTRRIAANTYLNRASIIAGTFGTLPGQITVPTTITADAGPICYLY